MASSPSRSRWRHMMLAKDDSDDRPGAIEQGAREVVEPIEPEDLASGERLFSIDWRSWTWHRDRYFGALLFNLGAFILPAVHGTLAKLWVANIDMSLVVTTDVDTYIGVVAETPNEGLPRAAWVIIGDKASRSHSQRLGLAHTLILFQSIMGLIMSIGFLAGARTYAKGFVPIEVREQSLPYVRISAFSALSSAIEIAVFLVTCALDKPDVPLIISTSKLAINVILDMLLNPARLQHDSRHCWSPLLSRSYTQQNPPRRAPLIQPSKPSSCSSAQASSPLPSPPSANALHLCLTTTIITLGTTYATAWGIFNTIRWGLVTVPVQPLEATSLTFIAHRWGYMASFNGGCESDGLHAANDRLALYMLRRVDAACYGVIGGETEMVFASVSGE
ncbi:hypothetical protein OQA88_6288 [Cercophora sp. LCS_1]